MWVCVPPTCSETGGPPARGPAEVLVLIPPPDPGTGDLYAMDDSQLVSDKSPLEEPPDVPSLRCSASPPLHAAGPFSLLAASRPAPPLLTSPDSPPALHGTWTAPWAPRLPPRGEHGHPAAVRCLFVQGRGPWLVAVGAWGPRSSRR